MPDAVIQPTLPGWITGPAAARIRGRAGIPEAELAARMNKLGVEPAWTVDYVVRVETGEVSLTDGQLKDLGEALDVDPDEFRRAVVQAPRHQSVDAAVGANLRRIREATEMTQADLAAHMTSLGTEWTASNVSLVEAGKRKLTLTALADLCRIFSVGALEFCGTAGSGVAVAERLRALGGTANATATASPNVVDNKDADAIARQRLAQRVLDRIVARVPWGKTQPDEQEFRREEVLNALEELYETRDLLDVREQLARQRARRAKASSQGGVPSEPMIEDIAEARGWATRRIAEQIAELLEPVQPGTVG